MTRREIFDGVATVLRERLQVRRPVTPSTDLFGDLEIDSLGALSLVVELENHFRICFAPGDEQGITKVVQLVDLVERCLCELGDCDERVEGGYYDAASPS